MTTFTPRPRPTPDARPVVPARPAQNNLLQRSQYRLICECLLEMLIIIKTAPEYSPDLLAAIRGHLDTPIKIANSYRMPSSYSVSTSRYLNPFPAVVEAVKLIDDLTHLTGFSDVVGAVGRINIHTTELMAEISPSEFARWREKHGV